ncbi:type I restriction enzyme S subunit [Christiangramia gaetbulicola]|uniref:Type I restriction enzyme S subunit n=1 Tax=Christiangramia gaetbulicola TaxID=703340 RepID=A0A2T6AK46_9FLAO|nr:type I restriction enzyme S subunit [Christiangramia gaetbulicola]
MRFPEFEDEWNVHKIEDTFSIFNGYAFSSSDAVKENGIIWVKIADVGINRMKRDNISYLPPEFLKKYEKFVLKENDYVIALTRPILSGKLKIARINSFFNNSLLNQRVGKIVTHHNSRFIFNLLQNSKLISKIENNIAGSDPPNLSAKEIKNIKVFLPNAFEQQKIASFLATVDKRINLLEQKKAKLEEYKKGVMQRIFSREIRFKDENGKEFPEWNKTKLKEVLTEHKKNNEEDKYDEVFSVSKSKGVINQIDHLGRSYAAKSISHYKLVFPFDIVYTKSPTSEFPFGIIKQNLTGRTGVVSTLYAVLKPKNQHLGYIIHSYFNSWVKTYNYLNPLVQKGAKNTMNINNKTFLDGKPISLPTSEKEQELISRFLEALDRKILVLNNQIETSNKFKKGLLQQMFV